MYFYSQTAALPQQTAASAKAQILEHAAQGDEEAFAQIYRTYAPMVHGILLSKVPYDDVRDLVQEVFLSAFRSLKTVRDPDAFGAWLARIARNRAVDHYRGYRPADELPEDLHGRGDKRAEAAEALAAIRSLPTAYRETLVLRLVEGMTGNEIAELTGLSPDSVRVNLHRGMNLLRRKLGIIGG